MADELVLGIDLGTTYSAVAAADGADVEVLGNRIGELTTPSVVHFASPGTAVVGAGAFDALDPDNTMALIKRRMGTDFDLLFHGERHTPESVSALILRSLADDARTRYGHRRGIRAVITVPAQFGIREREATRQAARLADIEVLELLSEPVAAAMHYGHRAPEGPRPGAALIYDLGGGTFDTTVLRAGAGGMEVVATDGDAWLGGADWNERIVAYLADTFAAECPQAELDEDTFRLRLQDEAERLKRRLSAATAHRVTLRCGDDSATFAVDRPTLKELGADLVERTLRIVDRVLTAAGGKGVPAVDEVLLVGGATRNPEIRTALAAHLGLDPKIIDPDLAVVSGAAVRARQIVEAGAPARTTAVAPRAYGLLIEDSHSPRPRRIIEHLVHLNDPLPTSATARFATIVAGQKSVRIQVFEQAGDTASAEVEHNRRVLDGEFGGLPPLPAGSSILVTLTISSDGLLTVTAVEPASGGTLKLAAYVDGVIDGGETERLKQTVAGLTLRC